MALPRRARVGLCVVLKMVDWSWGELVEGGEGGVDGEGVRLGCSWRVGGTAYLCEVQQTALGDGGGHAAG